MKCKSKFIHFHSRKSIWKCCLENAILYRPQCVNTGRLGDFNKMTVAVLQIPLFKSRVSCQKGPIWAGRALLAGYHRNAFYWKKMLILFIQISLNFICTCAINNKRALIRNAFQTNADLLSIAPVQIKFSEITFVKKMPLMISIPQAARTRWLPFCILILCLWTVQHIDFIWWPLKPIDFLGIDT